MKRFWVSWRQLTSDYRPLQDPPQPENIKAWWCSGQAIVGHNYTLCAIVDAESEEKAKAAILQGWQEKPGEIGEWRFCDEMENELPESTRFPITKDWEKERLGLKVKTVN